METKETLISENFSYEEFDYPPQEIKDNLQALVLNVLQPLRTAYGKPLNINSGYRNLKHNKLVGGVETSQHTKGQAADVHADNPYELACLAKKLRLPYDQMILYPTFVHFSHKAEGKGTNRGAILYNSNYKGKRL